ncbi:unnamed protein product [Cuscuta epithymum]|uniref:glucan endo-1,3-beta-D-glucosidase n=1 Tax=Cuscuta epithymum TaxID=186058 RepID=A0AAV0E6A6_9ASTE|nr:unnamed protein product [Cuscuta epithymum]
MSFPLLLLLLLGLISLILLSSPGSDFVMEAECHIGINYGQVGNNLPAPEKVLQLLQSLKVERARIYDTNPRILAAFAHSDVQLIVTLENEMLPLLGAADPQPALQWVASRILPYIPATNITGIAVGNEVLTYGGAALPYLVPAMLNIRAALALHGGLHRTIHVSSPCSAAVLASSFPPSAGSFLPELCGVMLQFLQFLAETSSPFWINAYPYFAYSRVISLDYILFNPNGGTVDPLTGLHYDNMLYAQVDAVSFAIYRMGFGGVEVRVSETGWPSKGGPEESGATPENAAIYNQNLMRRQAADEGTPLRPNVRLEVYVFALFNEDMKPGPASERNYGLFRPDGTMAYNVVGIGPTTSQPNDYPPSTSTPTPPNTTFSSATHQVKRLEYQSLCCWMFVYVVTSWPGYMLLSLLV